MRYGHLPVDRRGIFFYYTIKEGRESIINRDIGTIWAADKWQGYLLGNYRFYWPQVWDLHIAGKEATFMWSIWHKAVAVNEWSARIAPVSISKQCIFCLPNTSESVKHTLWDCIQTRKAWRWATFILHELCGVRNGNYDSLIGSKLSLGKGFPTNLAKILIFDTSFGASRFGPFGSSVIISCLTTNDGMS